MSESVQVRIIATDGSSAVFQKIGGSANQMGDAIERAGKDGATWLDQMGQSAQKNTTILGQLRDNATEVGAAIGTVVSVLSLLGRNSREAELQIDAINRAYEDQADVILDLTEKVQDYSRFSNDSAREAALTFQTLVDNYGVSIQQLDDLMIRSADVAQLRGKSLEEVSQMLQNAIRGEAEYAEAIGVTLNDSFLAAEYARRGLGEWTKLTDELEKAQFRYQILMEQTAYAAGTAGDQVANAGGRFRQFINELDDVGESIGGFLGPLAEIAAEMAPIAVALPVVAGGLGRLAQSAVAARVGVAALAVATSPLTLGLTALVGIGSLVIGSWMEQKQAAEDYNTALGDLSDTMELVRRQGDEDLAENIDSASDSISKLKTEIESMKDWPKFQDMLFEQTGDLDLYDIGSQVYQDALDQWYDLQETIGDVQADATEALSAINAAMSDPNVDASAYITWANDLLTAAAATEDVTDDIDALNQIIATQNEMPTEFLTAYNDKLQELNRTVSDGALAFATLFGYEPPDNVADAIDEIITKNEEAGASAEETAQRFADATSSYHQSVMDWLADGHNILGFLDDFAVKGREGTEWFEQFAEREWAVTLDITQANAAFDQVLRIFDQIDALGQRTSAAGAIADALFGDGGDPYDAVGPLVDLLDAGRISWEQFNATVESGIAIQESSARQTMILNEIRADQLPLLERQTLAYEDNLERLAALAPAEQRRALLLQDTAVQTQIADLYSQAYAASVGEIPEDVATAVILESAEADAGLKDLLLQFGLIEEMPDGELRVNFPDADETINAIDRMTLAFLNLAAVEQEISAFDLAVTIYGEEEAKELFGLVEEADGASADMTIGVNGAEEATQVVGFLYERVTNADGTEAYLIVRVDETGERTVDEIKRSVDNLDGTYTVQVEAKTGETYEALLSHDGEVISTSYVNVEPQINGIPGAANANAALSAWFGDTYSFDPIEVPVTITAGSASAGDGTDGAQNWRAMLDVPDEITTSITATVNGQEETEAVSTAIEQIPESKDATVGITVTGLEDVEAAAEAIEGLTDTDVTVTIDVDTSELDTTLAQWGIGDGGGGGGAADFTAPSVRVEFTADTSDIDDWTPPTIEPIEVAITGNAGGQDGALTVLSNLQSGGKEGYSVEVAVTTAGGQEAVSALDGVTAAADAIPESESVIVTALAEGATVALQGVTAAADDIPESESVTVNVYGAASAVSALNSVANAAANVPGSVSTTITTYRDTVYRTSGNPFAMALGGTVWGDDEPLRAANGRSVWVGEYGPELVSLPHGSQVTPHVASLSASGGGRGLGDINLGGIHVHGDVYGIEDLTDRVMREMQPALERARRQLEHGMGV